MKTVSQINQKEEEVPSQETRSREVDPKPKRSNPVVASPRCDLTNMARMQADCRVPDMPLAILSHTTS